MLYVLGIGPGSVDLLTDRVKDILKKSEILIGGRRNIESMKDCIESRNDCMELRNDCMELRNDYIEFRNDYIESRNDCMEYKTDGDTIKDNIEKRVSYNDSVDFVLNKEVYYITANLDSMRDYILDNKDKNISIIASGDPSLYGIGDYVLRNLSDDIDIEIVSGISSIQYCFGEFRLNMNDVYITSCHGRNLDYDFVFMHDKVAMVTDKKVGPREIALEIKSRNLNYNMYVGENLSYPNQKLYKGSSEDFLLDRVYEMCVVILMKSSK